MEKDDFCLVTSMGQSKYFESPWGMEPQTFGFSASMLYHWAADLFQSLPGFQLRSLEIINECTARCARQTEDERDEPTTLADHRWDQFLQHTLQHQDLWELSSNPYQPGKTKRSVSYHHNVSLLKVNSYQP